MATEKKLPFGLNSVVPELQDVPPSCKKEVIKSAPSFLRLSRDAQQSMTVHIELVGLDHHQFNYSVKEQRISSVSPHTLLITLPTI